MAPTKRRSILSKEDRINRLKESRLKYSQVSKAKNTIRPTTTANAPKLGYSRAVPKAEARKTEVVRKKNVFPIVSKPRETNRDNDFEVDPKSLAMIKSGKVTIPASRPSISTRSSIAMRPSISARPSLAARIPRQPRASIANEPRQSLLPLGINIFSANEKQKNELSQFLNSKNGDLNESANTTATPGRNESVGNVFNTATRQRKIRFMENVIPEQRESTDPSDEIATSSTSTHARHSPTIDNNFMPTSILSSKKRAVKRVIKLGSVFTEETRSDDKENGIKDIAQKLLKLTEDLLKSDCKIDSNVHGILDKVLENVNIVRERTVACEGFNETLINDGESSSVLPILQGDARNIKTPKAVKIFREQKTNVQPFNEIVERFLNVDASSSSNGNDEDTDEDDEKPAKKRRSCKLAITKDTSDKMTRALFRRRSSRLSTRLDTN